MRRANRYFLPGNVCVVRGTQVLYFHACHGPKEINRVAAFRVEEGDVCGEAGEVCRIFTERDWNQREIEEMLGVDYTPVSGKDVG